MKTRKSPTIGTFGATLRLPPSRLACLDQYVHLAANDILDAFDKYHPRAGDADHRKLME